MNFTNPSLILNFIDESTTITATAADLIKDSFIFKEQILNGLKSSSNQVQLQLTEDCSAIEYILRAQGDIKAQLKDGNTVLFTGYLSDSYRWTVTASGKQALSLVIEDVGTKLLGKTFLNNSVSSEHIFDEYINQSSSHSVVKEVCDACGITLDSNAPVVSVKVVKSIDRDTTCREILETMLYEAGYAYYFKADGRLSLYEINCTSTSGIPQLDSASLYVVDGNAITLTKKVKQIKQANITWTSLEYRNDVKVYEDISGQSSTYPHCNISIPVGGTYPDADGNVAKTEATDLEQGAELVYISDVTPDVSVVQGQYTSSVTQVGCKAIGVLLTNTGTTTVEVRKLQATADICAVKAKNVTIQGQSVASDESKNIFTYEAQYIHDTNSAKRLANLIINYHKYCNYTYTFYSKTNLAPGSLVEVVDDIHSGLDVNLLIIGRSYNDTTDIIQYTGVAVSAFDLSAAVYTDSTISAPTVIPGPVGKSVVDTDYYYKATATQTQPDPSTITSPTIPPLDATTNKYLWQKTVITYNDDTTETNVALIGVYGDETYTFTLKVTPSNFVIDHRRTDSQDITVSTTITGYSGTPTISYYFTERGPESVVSVTATSTTISIPYDNTHTSLHIQATLTGASPQTLTVMPIDKTQTYKYYGAFSIDTSDYFSGDTFVPENYEDIDWSAIDALLGTNEQFLDGDSFFNNYSESGFEDVYVYVYDNGVWLPIKYSTFSNSVKSIIISEAQNDVLSTIEPGSVTKSDLGYFNDIITQTVTADYVGSKEIEVKAGGFIYGGDVDITQEAGHRVSSSGSGFCFDSLGNAEVSNIRIAGDSTIEGGSTVLGTLINYDANNKPVFKTVKESEANVSMAGSKTDGTDNAQAYMWSDFYNYLTTSITSELTSGTLYTASGTLRGKFINQSTIVNKAIAAVKYYASAPPTTVVSSTTNGDKNCRTAETKIVWRNDFPYAITLESVKARCKTFNAWYGATGWGYEVITVRYSGGSIYQEIINKNYGDSMTASDAERTVYNVKVPAGGYIYADWGDSVTWDLGSDGGKGSVTVKYKESDNFTQGINIVASSNGAIYNVADVIPNTAAFNNAPQSLSITGTSVSFNIAMNTSGWPIEKYYRFTYSTSPGVATTTTSSIFSSQSFSYKGVSKTVSSITYSNTYLKVITTDGNVYEFYTDSGFYPRHNFSFTTLGQSLGAYSRSVLPTDDSDTHNLGAAGSYDSGVSRRWDSGFFKSLDVSSGIVASTVNSAYTVQMASSATNLGTIPVGTLKLVKGSASGITLSFTGTCLVIEFKGSNNIAVSSATSSYTTTSDGLILFIRLS